MKMLHQMIALSAALMSGVFAQAAEIGVDFDPSQTKITWQLVGNVHTVHGTFSLKRGHIALNTATGVVSGELVVDAGSGESGNQARDKRMNKEVLEIQRFPEIKFMPSKLDGTVTVSGITTAQLSGNFLVHGTTHQLSVPLEVGISGTTVTGKAKFSVPYVEWGLRDPSNFLLKVEKSVDLQINAVGHLSAGVQR